MRPVASLVAPLVLLLAAAAALVAGPGAFTALVVAAAVAVLLDLSGLLSRSSGRPVLLAALLPAAVLPLVAAADPALAWQRVPAFVATMLVGGFGLVLLSGRRAGVTAGLAATCLAGLLVGLGATSLLLLRALPDGFRWALALLSLVAVPAAAGAAVRLLCGEHGAVLGIRVLSAGVVGGALVGSLDPPIAPIAGAALTAVGLLALIGAELLGESLLAGAQGRGARPGPGRGLLLDAAGGWLLAAPGAYLLARAVAV